jgi:hypothetical protein
MFINVVWGLRVNDTPIRHMFQCNDFTICPVTDHQSTGPGGPAVYQHLVLDNGKHELKLSSGDTAYIMNDDGKTIDVLRA